MRAYTATWAVQSGWGGGRAMRLALAGCCIALLLDQPRLLLLLLLLPPLPPRLPVLPHPALWLAVPRHATAASAP
jgi:hypothetical protein